MVLRLIDTGVWIDWFRDRDTQAVSALIELRRQPLAVATTQPVLMEIKQGVSGAALTRVDRVFEGLTVLDVDPHLDFDHAADIYRGVRASGHTVRSPMDCLIAAVALRRNAILVHKDADFDRIAAVVPQLNTEAVY